MPINGETYQPAQVATILGVNVGTIRRWTTAAQRAPIRQRHT